MRILHTADWHLADRLGRIDRTDDLRRAVERVAGYCAEEKVDLLLVAGDLFSELAGPDSLREAIQQSARFAPALPAVLSAHVHVRGSVLPTLFRLTEQEDVVFSDADLPTHFAYIALGHIHRAQALGGQAHVRYSGSIERMDL